MRIIHILNHIQEIGNGIVNVAVDLACLQAKAGHAVGVASAGGEYEALLTRYGVRHFKLDQARTPINLIKASMRYRAMVQEFQPDIVHAHMITGVLLARVLRAQARYALVSTVHNEFQRSAVLPSSRSSESFEELRQPSGQALLCASFASHSILLA